MGIKLFVDDMRPCPSGWEPARSVTDAIRILASTTVDEVSLDHDIIYVDPSWGRHKYVWDTPECETFMPVAQYLHALQELDAALAETAKTVHHGLIVPLPRTPKTIRIHTSNFQRGAQMAEMLGIPYTPYIYDPRDYGDARVTAVTYWCDACQSQVPIERTFTAVVGLNCKHQLIDMSLV